MRELESCALSVNNLLAWYLDHQDALVQFLTIVLYHFLAYTCKYDVVAVLHKLRENAMRHFGNASLQEDDNVALFDIDEDDDNYDDEN